MINAIKQAYDACIPLIIAEDEVMDKGVRFAIKDYERQLDN